MVVVVAVRLVGLAEGVPEELGLGHGAYVVFCEYPVGPVDLYERRTARALAHRALARWLRRDVGVP